MEEEISEKTPEEIIRENIEKANILLDAAMERITNGTITPRMIEVTARVIDSVTTAAEKLIGASNEITGFELKREMLELKERELVMKCKNPSFQIGSVSQTNVIVKTREDLLKMLEDDKSIIDIEGEDL